MKTQAYRSLLFLVAGAVVTGIAAAPMAVNAVGPPGRLAPAPAARTPERHPVKDGTVVIKPATAPVDPQCG